MGLMFVLWNFFSYALSPALMKFKLFQVEQLYKIYSFIYELGGGTLDYRNLDASNMNWFGKYVAGMGLGIQKYRTALQNGYVFTFVELMAGWRYFGSYLSWIYIPLMLGFAIWYFKRSEAKHFKTAHSMNSLILQERELYPEIYPVSEENLIDSSDSTGKFASPSTEHEFATRHNLFMDSKEQNSMYRDEFGQEFRRLDKEKAKQVFDDQLKERFLGFEQMPRHRQAVFVLLGIGILDNTKTLNHKKQMILPKAREIAKAYYMNGGKLTDKDFGSWIEEYYEQFRRTEDFNLYVLNRHAYELPMFMSLIQACYRQQGVMNPTSLFWWLRVMDYPLFNALNYVGRQRSTFVDIAGVVSHYETEIRLKMPIIGKRTEKAVENLEKKLYKFTQDGIREAIFTPS